MADKQLEMKVVPPAEEPEEPQQIQKVKTYFTAHKPDVKRVDRGAVSVSIGIAVPGSIGLYPLPPMWW